MLNKSLYDQLKRAFGEVRVANEGRSFKGELVRDPLNRGTSDYRVRVIDKGESYTVCCPFCGDQRFRLWFGHRWGTKFRGVPVRYAAICFNEDCHKSPEFYGKIKDMLIGYIQAPKVIKQGSTEQTINHATLPGDCIPINQLESDHYAIQYMRSRGYDIDDLAKNWHIVWRVSGSALSDYYRLIIPIYARNGDEVYLAGWQARYLNQYSGSGVPHDKCIPKYMTSTGLRKSQILYNGWRIDKSPLTVVCEGPLDAIRVGLAGVAVLGSDASTRQETLLVEGCKQRKVPIIVMIDNDMEEKALNLTKRLKTRGCLAVRVNAPDGKDPGDCTRDELDAVIAQGILSMCKDVI